MMVLSEQKGDRRIKKSKQAIQQALLKLMNEKPFDKITVSELAQEADINRKTFYNHYESVQAVRKELDNNFIHLIITMIRDVETDGMSFAEFLNEFAKRLIDTVEEEQKSAKLLFESGELYALTEKLKEIIHPTILSGAREVGIDTANVLFYVEYIISGTLSVLRTWICSGYLISKKDVEAVLIKLILSNIPEDIKGKKMLGMDEAGIAQ